VDRAQPGAIPYLRSAAYREVIAMECPDRAKARPVETMSDPKQPNNLRTALILVSIVLVFFIGVFVKRIWFS
jgi:hypothetical protein